MSKTLNVKQKNLNFILQVIGAIGGLHAGMGTFIFMLPKITAVWVERGGWGNRAIEVYIMCSLTMGTPGDLWL